MRAAYRNCARGFAVVSRPSERQRAKSRDLGAARRIAAVGWVERSRDPTHGIFARFRGCEPNAARCCWVSRALDPSYDRVPALVPPASCNADMVQAGTAGRLLRMARHAAKRYAMLGLARGSTQPTTLLSRPSERQRAKSRDPGATRQNRWTVETSRRVAPGSRVSLRSPGTRSVPDLAQARSLHSAGTRDRCAPANPPHQSFGNGNSSRYLR